MSSTHAAPAPPLQTHTTDTVALLTSTRQELKRSSLLRLHHTVLVVLTVVLTGHLTANEHPPPQAVTANPLTGPDRHIVEPKHTPLGPTDQLMSMTH